MAPAGAGDAGPNLCFPQEMMAQLPSKLIPDLDSLGVAGLII